MLHRTYQFFLILTLLFITITETKANCGKVTIAEMKWASAQLIANLDKIILSKGFGCNVDLVPGDTMPTFTSMNEKGRPDVAPELWANSNRIALEKAEKEGRLHIVNKGPISGLGEGWWIPPYTAKKNPELRTVLDVIKRPDLFPHPEDKTKGAFVSCPAGWGCQLANANLFRAFDMEKKGWLIVNPGSGAGLDGSIAKSLERQKSWFGYYWSPTALIGKYKLVKLPFGVPFGGKNNWDTCIAKPEQDCFNPKPSSWTQSEVWTIVTDNFKKRNSSAASYFEKRVISGTVMNAMLVYMQANQADGADAAVEFMKKYPEIWSTWVASEIVSKIKG